MVCSSALSFLNGKICAIQKSSIIIIIIKMTRLHSDTRTTTKSPKTTENFVQPKPGARLQRKSDDDDGWLLAREDLGEGGRSVLARSVEAAESESWCAHPAALWTDEGLGWGWFAYCSRVLHRKKAKQSCTVKWILHAPCDIIVINWKFKHELWIKSLFFSQMSASAERRRIISGVYAARRRTQ